MRRAGKLLALLAFCTLAALLALPRCSRHAVRKQEHALRSAVTTLSNGAGPTYAALSAEARAWLGRQQWHLASCQVTGFGYDTNAMFLSCGAKKLILYFHQDCDGTAFELMRFVRITACDATARLPEIVEQKTPDAERFSIFMEGRPVTP